MSREIYWTVDYEAPGSLVWRDIIAVNAFGLNYHGSACAHKSRHVANFAKGMLSLAGGLLVEEEVDVDIWCYRYYAERPYVANIFALPAAHLFS